MKEFKRNKDSHHNPVTDDPNEGIKWFEQFDDKPGIYDMLNEVELNTLKRQMLTNIKTEINKQD